MAYFIGSHFIWDSVLVTYVISCGHCYLFLIASCPGLLVKEPIEIENIFVDLCFEGM